jgi:hypothetical protein
MAHPRVSAKRFTKSHFLMQNSLKMAVIAHFFGNTGQKHVESANKYHENVGANYDHYYYELPDF